MPVLRDSDNGIFTAEVEVAHSQIDVGPGSAAVRCRTADSLVPGSRLASPGSEGACPFVLKGVIPSVPDFRRDDAVDAIGGRCCPIWPLAVSISRSSRVAAEGVSEVNQRLIRSEEHTSELQ